MVRAPCCEKMGLKKGPWTAQEDRVLVDYISRYGHGNWRALPKQAGLLRCGKSCRLRWTNYLRPDIKRGNFTKDEEETIIQLHQALGNRWSAIAARLPGRTDNEIKNVWHTHLKKRLNLEQNNQCTTKTQCTTKSEPVTVADSQPHDRSCSEVSSSSTAGNTSPETEEDFWSEVLSSAENCTSSMVEPSVTYGNMSEGMEFWFEVFTRSAEDLLLLPESPEI